ncbi:MAG: hypothetical protein LBB84_11825 [Tannerellaceae bacterium]|jgi:hypothetical protein|nr:hypothetical protein [Tannerellaceae bacterium]
MDIYISTQKDAVDDIIEVYRRKYHRCNVTDNSIITIRSKLRDYMERIREDIHILIETDYVDKMYRDQYYNYYSTKRDDYYRDCIRISFFNSPIREETFFTKEGTLKAREEDDYLGFLLIRPTFPKIIGRNVLSPKALKPELGNFRTCTTCFSATANGVKFDVTGFPHASQDGEMLCCADITIWAMMEYFGNKYPEYCVVLPSKTMTSLGNIMYQRQLPTAGLSIESISYALKEHGLGPKIFSREEWDKDKDKEFEPLFSCYIESGLPIVVTIEDTNVPNSEGHAIICVGHVEENMEECLRDPEFETFGKTDGLINVYDWDKVRKEFIFMDDNCPPYQKAYLEEPLDYYKLEYYKEWKITHFIVPLYPKIYLDAHEAKQQILSYIKNRKSCYLNPQWDDRIILRTFLTSSRSYKQYIMHNEELNRHIQQIILEMEFPKFVWVGELSAPEFVKDKKINGLIILDATEPRYIENESLLFIANSTRIAYKSEKPTINKFREEYIEPDSAEKSKENEINVLPLQPFNRFESNIKNFMYNI